MMWCQWQLVQTRIKVSKQLKGSAEGLKFKISKTLFRIKNLLLINDKFILITFFNKSIHLWFGWMWCRMVSIDLFMVDLHCIGDEIGVEIFEKNFFISFSHRKYCEKKFESSMCLKFLSVYSQREITRLLCLCL